MADEPRHGRHKRQACRTPACVVGSKVDIALRPAGADRDELLIPATPNFFVRYRYV